MKPAFLGSGADDVDSTMVKAISGKDSGPPETAPADPAPRQASAAAGD